MAYAADGGSPYAEPAIRFPDLKGMEAEPAIRLLGRRGLNAKPAIRLLGRKDQKGRYRRGTLPGERFRGALRGYSSGR